MHDFDPIERKAISKLAEWYRTAPSEIYSAVELQVALKLTENETQRISHSLCDRGVIDSDLETLDRAPFRFTVKPIAVAIAAEIASHEEQLANPDRVNQAQVRWRKSRWGSKILLTLAALALLVALANQGLDFLEKIGIIKLPLIKPAHETTEPTPPNA